jgi:predicted phage tail protein
MAVVKKVSILFFVVEFFVHTKFWFLFVCCCCLFVYCFISILFDLGLQMLLGVVTGMS